MRVLVTGAHGYLGSAIFAAFAGHDITAVVSPWGDTSPIDSTVEQLNARVERIDLSGTDSLDLLVADHDVIVHAAARALDYGPWNEFERINVHGTTRLAEAAKRAGVKRFVFISTIAVHRYSGYTNAISTELPRNENRYPYARSKRLAEDALFALADDSFEVVVLRPGLWPHGARDPSLRRMIPALRTGMLPLVGGGNAHLNLVSATTFADATVRAATAFLGAERVFVIADSGMPTWRDVFAHITTMMGVSPPRFSVPEWIVLPLAFELELGWRVFAPKKEPPLTQYRARLMTRSAHFDPAPAAAALGYELKPWQDTLTESVEAVLGQ